MSVVERIPHGCPQCRGDVVIIDAVVADDQLHNSTKRAYTVVCPQCMFGSSPNCRTREEALASWEKMKDLIAAEKVARSERG